MMHVSGSPHLREAYADQLPKNHQSLVKIKTNIFAISVPTAQIQFPLASPRRATCVSLHTGFYLKA